MQLGNYPAWYSGVSAVWYAIRAGGLTAYVLLFTSVVSGILQSLPFTRGKWRKTLYTVHGTTCFWGLMFGMMHGFLLLFDRHTVAYTLDSIIIPFVSSYKPLQTSLGIFSLYIMLILAITSQLIKRLGRKLWRAIHHLAFPGYLFALLHGVSIGTDSHYGDIKLLYTLTGSTVLALLLLRLKIPREKPAVKTSATPAKYYQNPLRTSGRRNTSIAPPVRAASDDYRSYRGRL